MKSQNPIHPSPLEFRLRLAAMQTSAAKQKNPPKAYENLEFIRSPYGRSVRVLSEMTEPLQRLNRMRIRNTIVFFGSARILDPERALDALFATEAAAQTLPSADAAALLVRARADVEFSEYYAAARKLAGAITLWSKTLPKSVSPFYLCSGGGPGIMEATNRGASEVGGITIGLGISLPYEQSINPYVTQGLSFEFHYFFVRKYWFLTLARAVVVFPGGFGTMDEMFELLTLAQTKKINSIPIVLFGRKYWNELINFDAFVKWGMIDKEDLKLFQFADTIEEAKSILFPALEVFCQEHDLANDPAHVNPHMPHHARYTPSQRDNAAQEAAGGSTVGTPA